MKRLTLLLAIVLTAVIINCVLPNVFINDLKGLYVNAASAESIFTYPLKDYRVTGPFKPNRVYGGNRTAHLATDCVSDSGNWEVYPICEGTCVSVRAALSDGAGRYVIIEHCINNVTFYTEYQHLQDFYCNVGEKVYPTQCMAIAGSTGTSMNSYDRHLHFEIYTGRNWPWQSPQLDYIEGQEYDGPITINGTTYYNPDRVLKGLSFIDGIGNSLPEEPEITGATYPENLSNGSSFGLRGNITCKYTMTKIEAVLTNRATHQVITFDPAPEAWITANSYSLGSEPINNNMIFNDSRLYDSHLNYSLIVTYEKDGVFYTKKVIDHNFTVGNPGELIWVTLPASHSFGLGSVADIYTELNIDGSFTGLNWSSSNTDVLRAINGRLYGVGCGEAVLTATTTDDPSVSAQCIVSVYVASVQDVGDLPLSTGAKVSHVYLDNTQCGEMFSFYIQNETASYTFYSLGNSITYAILYDESLNVLKWGDGSDGNGSMGNFSLSYVLTPGKTYYLFVRGYDSTPGIELHVYFKRTITDMTEGTVYTVNVEKSTQHCFYSFTPSENGIYSFTSSTSGNQPTYAILRYNSPTGSILAYGNENGNDLNFLIEYELTAGERYYLETGYVSNSIYGTYNVSVNKNAPAYIANGTCGDNLTWTLTADGTLTITGTGEMNDYSSDTVPWKDHVNDITAVAISQGVISIGNRAFYNCSCLISVTIPDSVTSIGNYAFENCSSLTSITIPSGVTSIGDRAFSDCSSLDEVHISSLEAWLSINFTNAYSNPSFYAHHLFLGDSELTDVVIPDSVTSVGKFAFSGCSSLTSITIPDSVTSIGWSAFNLCSSLTSVTIPDSVTSIDIFAFSGCSSLTSITIPASVTSIGEDAFGGCENLTISCYANSAAYTYAVANNIPYELLNGGTCGPNTYWEYANGTLTITGTGEMNGYDTDTVPWKDYKNDITAVEISQGVTSIGFEAFNHCSNLTSITIPDSVTSIGGCAFFDCSSLESITIPDSVTSIGGAAFAYCSSLSCITIPDGVTSIDGAAFSGCSSLTSITIPDSVTSIGVYAFNECSSLTSITIPDSVTNIESRAFYSCSSLTSITIPDGVTNIGSHAFYDCGSLTNITIPGSVTSIGEWAFSYCSSLVSIVIPYGVKSIGEEAFTACGNLTSIAISDSVTTIGDCAFSGCGLTSITIPGSVTSIGEKAFKGCSSLTSITIPASVTDIGTDAFDFCANLTVVIPVCGSYAQQYAVSQSLPVTVQAHQEIVNDPAVPATCVATGLTEGSHCAVCGEVIQEQTIEPMTGHAYTTVNIPATCTAPGVSNAVRCVNCGMERMPGDEIPATGHTVVIDPAVPATCVATGLTEGSHCAVCGEVLQEQTAVAMTDHSYAIVNIPATCAAPGISNAVRCTICGHVMVEGEEIPPTDHAVVIDPAVPATCIATGLTEGSHCAVCGEVLQEQTVVPVSDHSYAIVNIPATCAAPGVSNSVRCTICGHVMVEGEEIPPTDHTVVIDPAVPATCVANGLTEGSHCAVCGLMIRAQETIPTTDHQYAVFPEQAATCEEPGTTSYVACKICGHVLVAGTEIPALGHDWHSEYAANAAAGTVTLQRVCARDPEHIEIESVMPALVLPNGLRDIEEEAFAYMPCQAVIIPEGCESIGRKAFMNCVTLVYVRVPAGTAIAEDAFLGCPNVVIERTN